MGDTSADPPQPSAHAEYYHSLNRDDAPALTGQEWEKTNLKDTSAIAFNASGTYCAFGSSCGALEIYETSALPCFAFSLNLSDSFADGAHFECRGLAWSSSAHALAAFYVDRRKHSDSPLGLLCVWDVRHRKLGHAVLINDCIAGMICIADGGYTIFAQDTDAQPLVISLPTNSPPSMQPVHPSQRCAPGLLESRLGCPALVLGAADAPIDASGSFQNGRDVQSRAPMLCPLVRCLGENEYQVYFMSKGANGEPSLCRIGLTRPIGAASLAAGPAECHPVPRAAEFPTGQLSGYSLQWAASESDVRGDVLIALSTAVPRDSGSSLNDCFLLFDGENESFAVCSHSPLLDSRCDSMCPLRKPSDDTGTKWAFLTIVEGTFGVHSGGAALGLVTVQRGPAAPVGAARRDSAGPTHPTGVLLLAVSPRGHLAYALSDGRHGRCVHLIRAGAESSFAGVEYPLGYHRVDDSTVYLEREDEFDRTVIAAEDKQLPKAAPTRKTTRRWFEMEAVGQQGGESAAVLGEACNALVNAEYFKGSKRRRMGEPETGLGAASTGVGISIPPSAAPISGVLPVLPADLQAPSAGQISKGGPSALRSVGPSESARRLIKGGAQLPDPCKILTSAVQRRDPLSRKLGLLEKKGCSEFVNGFGAPPVGRPYLCDAFNGRIPVATEVGTDEVSPRDTLLRGIAANYTAKIRSLAVHIGEERDTRAAAARRMAQAQGDSERRAGYVRALKERAEAQHEAFLARKAQMQALRKERAAEQAKARAAEPEPKPKEDMWPPSGALEGAAGSRAEVAAGSRAEIAAVPSGGYSAIAPIECPSATGALDAAVSAPDHGPAGGALAAVTHNGMP